MGRLTSILINFGIVFLIGYFWIFPQYQAFQEVNSVLRNKKIELQRKEEYFSKIKMADEALQQYKEQLSKIDVALPSEPSLPSLLSILEKSGTENGLILKQVGSFKVTDLQRSLKEIHLEVGLMGSYPALKNFLSSLERNARLIEVDKISFSLPRENEPFTFDLDIKTYSY